MESGVKYVTVSIPRAIAEKIDQLIEGLGYWPSRSSFVREACLDKIRVEMQRLVELQEAMSGVGGPRQGGGDRQGSPVDAGYA